MKKFFKELFYEIIEVAFPLFKILIPFTIILRVIEILGLVEPFAKFFEPFMGYLGLPGELGFVWATAMLINFYAGIIVFINLFPYLDLTVAQITVLCVLMLQAHNLLIESSISKLAGVGYVWTISLRIISALLMGYFLHLIYSKFGLLKESFVVTLIPTAVPTEIFPWIIYQIKVLLYIFAILSFLVFLMKVIRKLGIEKIIRNILSPFLNKFGIHKKASEIIVVGMILGLTFGAGFLIKESKSGNIDKKSIILSVLLLNLLHALIEDTGLMLIIGGHLSGIFFYRIIFCLFLIYIINKLFFRNKNQT